MNRQRSRFARIGSHLKQSAALLIALLCISCAAAAQPSVDNVDTLEIHMMGKTRRGSLKQRVEDLERMIFGKRRAGDLQSRVSQMLATICPPSQPGSNLSPHKPSGQSGISITDEKGRARDLSVEELRQLTEEEARSWMSIRERDRIEQTSASGPIQNVIPRIETALPPPMRLQTSGRPLHWQPLWKLEEMSSEEVSAYCDSLLEWLDYPDEHRPPFSSDFYSQFDIEYSPSKGKMAETNVFVWLTIDELTQLSKDKRSSYVSSLRAWLASPANSRLPVIMSKDRVAPVQKKQVENSRNIATKLKLNWMPLWKLEDLPQMEVRNYCSFLLQWLKTPKNNRIYAAEFPADHDIIYSDFLGEPSQKIGLYWFTLNELVSLDVARQRQYVQSLERWLTSPRSGRFRVILNKDRGKVAVAPQRRPSAAEARTKRRPPEFDEYYSEHSRFPKTSLPANVVAYLHRSDGAPAVDTKTIAKLALGSTVVIGTPSRSGSGFVITPGVIATNHHVVEDVCDTDDVRVKLVGTERVFRTTKIIGNEARDIALLYVPSLHAPPLPVADSDKAAVGERVYAVGSPLGDQHLEGTFAEGMISGLHRDYDWGLSRA